MPGEVVGQLGGAAPVDDAARIGAEQVGHRLAKGGRPPDRRGAPRRSAAAVGERAAQGVGDAAATDRGVCVHPARRSGRCRIPATESGCGTLRRRRSCRVRGDQLRYGEGPYTLHLLPVRGGHHMLSADVDEVEHPRCRRARGPGPRARSGSRRRDSRSAPRRPASGPRGRRCRGSPSPGSGTRASAPARRPASRRRPGRPTSGSPSGRPRSPPCRCSGW